MPPKKRCHQDEDLFEAVVSAQLKKIVAKLHHFPKFRDENKTYVETTTQYQPNSSSQLPAQAPCKKIFHDTNPFQPKT